MTQLILLRHGQSEWNLQNRFTGWVDVDLTEKGVAEATKAGALIRDAGLEVEGAYVSVLTRAIRTLHLALSAMDRLWLPVQKHWRLNERHYGGLTGLDKAETAIKHGEDQVRIWRRSYDTPPPAMEPANAHNPATDPRYAHLAPGDVPMTESLKTTLDRVSPYWQEEIAPGLIEGRSLIIAAHGNSLRAIVKLLMAVPDEEIVGVEIPTGNPLVFDFAPGGLTPNNVRYLDESRAAPLPPTP